MRYGTKDIKRTYEVVVFTAHGIGAASNVYNVDGRAVDTNGHGNSAEVYAEGGK